MDVETFVKKNVEIIINLMGEALDLARISGMSDRSFNQFQVSYKKKCFEKINELVKVAKDEKLVDESFKIEMGSKDVITKDRRN